MADLLERSPDEDLHAASEWVQSTASAAALRVLPLLGRQL